MSTVYLTKGGRRWHADRNCRALDSGRMLWDADESWPHYIQEVAADETGGRTPCLVCASQPGRATWVLTRENLGELMELATYAKPHHSYPAGSKTLAVDGLTIWSRHDGPRQWARFNDTIRRDGRQWTVTSPDGDPR